MTTATLLPAVLLNGIATAPLSCDVVARATGLDVELRITQTVGNTAAAPAELSVHVPVTATGAVRHVEATIGGVTVVATLEDKHQARAAYDMAVAAGRTAALAEDNGGDVVVLTFGNVPAGDVASCTVVVDDSLTVEAQRDRLVARLVLPTSIGERYGAVAGVQNHTMQLRASFTALPTESACSLRPGAVPLDTELAFPLAVGAAAAFEFTLDEAQLLPAHAHLVPDGDLGRARRPGDGAFPHDATVAFPVITARDATLGAVELVVVVDRSGSMDGWKQTLADDLAARLVERLGDGDRVAAYAFDDSCERVVPGEESASAPALAAASAARRAELARRLRLVAARGGTETAAAMRQIAAELPATAPGARRVTVLLTDGQVDDDRGVMAAAAHLGELHVVAIGEGMHLGLLASLGHVVTVESPERLVVAADALELLVRAPAITAVRVATLDGVELPVDVSNPLVAGTAATAYARAPKGLEAIRLTVQRADGVMVSEVVPVVRREPSLSLRARFGRLAIRRAERALAVGTIAREELVRLSLAASVLCSETAFVAVGRELTPHELTPAPSPMAMTMAAPVALARSFDAEVSVASGYAPPPGAPTLGVTRERIGRMEAKTLAKLRRSPRPSTRAELVAQTMLDRVAAELRAVVDTLNTGGDVRAHRADLRSLADELDASNAGVAGLLRDLADAIDAGEPKAALLARVAEVQGRLAAGV